MNVGREWNMRNGFSGWFEFLIACRENIKAWLEINWKSLLNASSALNTTGDRQRRNETRSWIFHCLLSNFTRFLSIKRHQTLKQEVAQEVADLTNNMNKLSLNDDVKLKQDMASYCPCSELYSKPLYRYFQYLCDTEDHSEAEVKGQKCAREMWREVQGPLPSLANTIIALHGKYKEILNWILQGIIINILYLCCLSRIFISSQSSLVVGSKPVLHLVKSFIIYRRISFSEIRFYFSLVNSSRSDINAVVWMLNPMFCKNDEERKGFILWCVILCDETYLNTQLRAVQMCVRRQRSLSPRCSVFPRRQAAAVCLRLAGSSRPFGSSSEPFLVHWSGPVLLHLLLLRTEKYGITWVEFNLINTVDTRI